jgi:hypothetical protein
VTITACEVLLSVEQVKVFEESTTKLVICLEESLQMQILELGAVRAVVLLGQLVKSFEKTQIKGAKLI